MFDRAVGQNRDRERASRAIETLGRCNRRPRARMNPSRPLKVFPSPRLAHARFRGQ